MRLARALATLALIVLPGGTLALPPIEEVVLRAKPASRWSRRAWTPRPS